MYADDDDDDDDDVKNDSGNAVEGNYERFDVCGRVQNSILAKCCFLAKYKWVNNNMATTGNSNSDSDSDNDSNININNKFAKSLNWLTKVAVVAIVITAIAEYLTVAFPLWVAGVVQIFLQVQIRIHVGHICVMGETVEMLQHSIHRNLKS